MEEIKKYYKIVRPENSKLFSYIMGRDIGKGLQYIPQEWTRPVIPKSKIFIFNTLGAAISFFSKEENLAEIWEVEAINPQPLLVKSRDISRAEVFWNGDNSTKQIYGNIPPFGTIGADEIFLKKKVLSTIYYGYFYELIEKFYQENGIYIGQTYFNYGQSVSILGKNPDIDALYVSAHGENVVKKIRLDEMYFGSPEYDLNKPRRMQKTA